MRDADKTKKQLMRELEEARRRLAEPEASEGEHKRAEAALRESEEKYRTLVEDALIGIMNVDLTGKITYVNKTILEATGYSWEEMVGKNAFRLGLISDETIKVLRERMKKKLMGQTTGILEIQYKRKDGEWIWLQIRGMVLRKHNMPVGIQIIGDDITERRRAEEELRESQEFSTSLLESSPTPIVVINPDTSVKYINPALEKLTGFSPADVIGKKAPYLWWTPETLKKTTRDLKEAMHKGTERLEELFQKKNGELFWVEITSTPVTSDGQSKYFLANWVDVTERKQAEAALRENEEKVTVMLQSIGDHMSMLDKDLNILWANETAKRIFGNDIIGKKCYEVYHRRKEPCEPYPCLTLKAFQDGKTHQHDTQVISKDGEIIYFHCTANVALRDEKGEPLGVIEISRDITERRRAEEQAREAETLRELDRLRNELLANISHELRTPLASIKGFATMLLDYDRKLKRDEKRDYLETIDKNTDRLAELIEQLLEMSRLVAGMLTINRVRTGINKLCWEAIAEAQVRSNTHRFALDLPRKSPRVNIDARRIRQVLDNLISNAVKYSQAGTEVALAARRVGRELLVTVTDRGTGIPVKDQSRVFERMFRSGQSLISGEGGVGLGLSICKGLVEAHGGRIWIESEEGKGTRCFFTLPLNNGPGDSHGKKAQG